MLACRAEGRGFQHKRFGRVAGGVGLYLWTATWGEGSMEVVRDMGQPLPPLSNLRVRMRPPQTSCIRAFVLKCVKSATC